MTISFRELAERMDPVRPPQRLRGKTTPYNDPDGDESEWNQGGETAKELAYDFGLYHSREKGLFQVHRRETNSFREVGERHHGQDSTHHRMLVYNTALLGASHDEVEARAKDIGRMIGYEDYDIACLCEVFGADDGDLIRNRVDNYGKTSWQEAFGPPDDWWDTSGGLYGLVGGDERVLVHDEHQTYSDEGQYADEFANKGWLLMEVDLGPGSLDIFMTHTDAGTGDVESRKTQIEELMSAVQDRQRHYPENVTMVVGDLNVYSSNNEYHWLLEEMDSTCSLRDVWLTRGGKASATHSFDIYCSNVNPPDCACDDYDAGDYGGDRLDYVFLEDPQAAHDMNLDVARMRRRPFRRTEPCGDIDPSELVDSQCEHMSDHLGLHLELIASNK